MKRRLRAIVVVTMGLVLVCGDPGTALTPDAVPSSLPAYDGLKLFVVGITKSDGMYAFAVLNGTVSGGHLIDIGRAAGVADFDNDGFCEVLAVRESDRLLRLYDIDGGMRFIRAVVSDDAYPSTSVLHEECTDSAVGDFDNNSLVDFAFSVERSIQIHLNYGDGQFERRSIDVGATSGRMCGLDSGDFNADGSLDLVAQRYWFGADNVTHVLLGNGDGTFTDSEAFTTPNVSGAPGVTSGDFNRDGHLDLIVGQDDGGDPGQTWLHVGDGTGAFTYYGPAYDTNLGSETSMAAPGDGHPGAYDVDGDGNPDIVTAAEGIGLFLYKGNGDGSFQAPVTVAGGSKWFWVATPVGGVRHDVYIPMTLRNSCSRAPACLSAEAGSSEARDTDQ